MLYEILCVVSCVTAKVVSCLNGASKKFLEGAEGEISVSSMGAFATRQPMAPFSS